MLPADEEGSPPTVRDRGCIVVEIMVGAVTTAPA
jgi:hypothetical protein